MKLIVAEKPSAAQKIAFSLNEGKFNKLNHKGVPYYNISRDGEDMIVASAVGHLYTLDEVESKGWIYPVFDIKWKAIYEARKEVKYAKNYVSYLKSVKDKVDEIIVATDYDTEGEVIGLNVVRFALKKKDASRMKFSTLTKPDLVDAFNNRQKTLDWGQGYAGEARHFLDWYYGINLSRALTSAYKTASNSFAILTTGRVQGPTLKLIVDQEKLIQAFIPTPYWELYFKNKDFEAMHEKGRFEDENEVKNIYEKIKDEKQGKLIDIKKTEKKIPSPYPFDLTTLQSEAYRLFKKKPQKTLEIAQSLYLAGCISYPRTSSQKLDPKLGFKKIINKISENPTYRTLSLNLLKNSNLRPNNGKKEDPAHPAIYPTGQIKEFSQDERKIYDLVVKRFLATFADWAKRELVELNIDVKKELFKAKGTHTTYQGWYEYYSPYVKIEEKELPKLNVGDIIDIKKMLLDKKMTQPPKRYSPSSIIKELEKRDLGTKATRAQIIESLYDRKYVVGDNSIEPTTLGILTVETLQKYSPEILSEELTRNFELEMEKIRSRKLEPEKLLEEAKKVLLKILDDFKSKEKMIGKELNEAVSKTRKEINSFGTCPDCGSALTLRNGKFGKFIACTNYPDCKFSYNLPNKVSKVKETKKECEVCGKPIYSAIVSRKSVNFCINPQCKSNDKTPKKTDKKCPKCGSPLVLRKGLYGEFYGCSNYPKCKHIENIDKKK